MSNTNVPKLWKYADQKVLTGRWKSDPYWILSSIVFILSCLFSRQYKSWNARLGQQQFDINCESLMRHFDNFTSTQLSAKTKDQVRWQDKIPDIEA